MSLVRELAVRVGWLENRRERRLPARELNATYVAGSKRKRVPVKDISSGGLYLFTGDRWMPGTSIEVTIRKRSLFETQPAESVRLRARSVRLGEDGVGLAFEPDHVGADIWMSLFVKAAGALRQKDTVRTLRISRALAFLRRISPAAESAVMEHIAGECIFESGERAVETILNAEEIVESWNFAIRSGVDRGLILSILENASRANSDLIRQHWTGLLASSIQYWARDCESAQFVSLLSLLDPVQIRILEAVCSRALRAGRDAGDFVSHHLAYSKQALRNAAGVSNYQVIEQHLDGLSFLELLEPAIKCAWFEEFEQIELTPTERGLKFYARCRG
ncbi:MAG: PilZ domain-containing protein, partial [Terracidiphilus sp.]